MQQQHPKVAIIGASGYAGAELANLVQKHPYLDLYGLYVSSTSKDAHRRFSELYPMYSSLVDQELIPLDDDQKAMNDIKQNADIICLCTAHEVSMIFPVPTELTIRIFMKNTTISNIPTLTGWRVPFTVLLNGMPIRSEMPS